MIKKFISIPAVAIFTAMIFLSIKNWIVGAAFISTWVLAARRFLKNIHLKWRQWTMLIIGFFVIDAAVLLSV